MSWNPIFTDTLRDSTWQKIHEIASILLQADNTDPFLMHGDIGDILFLFYYCSETGNEEYYEKATRLFFDCIDKQKPLLKTDKDIEPLSSFENGLSGFGWCLTHFQAQEITSGEVFDTMGTVDPQILRSMIYHVQNDRYGFLQGASGIALYCLNKPDRFAEEYLNRFVWELYKRICSNKLNSIDDFSIPTGLAGLWCVLQKISDKHFRIEYLSDIINCITDILIRQKTVELTDKKGIIPGWNRNEVGLLWTRFQIPQTKSQALEQWVDYGKLYLDNDDCFESGLYGGNFSLGHLFNRIYQQTGETKFKHFAERFFLKGLQHVNYTEPQTGYDVWNTGINNVYGFHRGLLGGLSGIGLALLSTVSDESPDWDESLLLS